MNDRDLSILTQVVYKCNQKDTPEQLSDKTLLLVKGVELTIEKYAKYRHDEEGKQAPFEG